MTFLLVSPISFFQFLLGLLFPLSIGTFISLFNLEFFVSIRCQLGFLFEFQFNSHFFFSIYIPFYLLSRSDLGVLPIFFFPLPCYENTSKDENTLHN